MGLRKRPSVRTFLCNSEDMKSGEARKFDVAGRLIAVVRIDDDFYAVGDTCSHAKYSLSEGDVYIEDKEIECWKHGSTFSLVDGKPQSLPATKAVPVYNVVVDGNDVFVDIEED